MAQYIVTDTELEAIADAIRAKLGSSDSLEWPSGFADAIDDISGGGGGSNYEYDAYKVWTKSTGGYDASMYVQKGTYKPEDLTEVFEGTGEIIDVLYTTVSGSGRDFDGVFSLLYNSNWYVTSQKKVFAEGSFYEAQERVKLWKYNTDVSFYIVDVGSKRSGSGGGSSVELMTRAEWNALTTAQKQAKGYVGIQDSLSGFKRGILVNGADYLPIGIYLPETDASKVLCEAYLGNFDNSSLTWGDGNSPINLTDYVSAQNDEYVSIPVKSNGTLAYVDLGENSHPFTAYVVMKLIGATQYSRLICAMSERSSSKGILAYGSTINIGSWGNDTSTGISSSDFRVVAIQFSGSGSALGIVYGGSFISKAPTTAGRYLTIGRTDIASSTSNAEPCDCYVKYMAVVDEAENQTKIEENIEYLYNTFISS